MSADRADTPGALAATGRPPRPPLHALRSGGSVRPTPLWRQRPGPEHLPPPGRGTVAFSSAPNVGTTFELDLTLEKALPVRSTPAPGAGGIAGTRLLIVDPNTTTVQRMQQHTASWGVESWVVASGGEALASLRGALRHGRALQIALIDRSLPDVSGEELGHRIKSDPELRSTQMVMVASSGLRGDAARVSKIGFAAYLPKPVTANPARVPPAAALAGR